MRVPSKSGEILSSSHKKANQDFGTGGWALTSVDIVNGTAAGGRVKFDNGTVRDGFVFHEDANANGTAGCIAVGPRKILRFYDEIRKTAKSKGSIYLLVEDYETGRQKPSWAAYKGKKIKDEF